MIVFEVFMDIDPEVKKILDVKYATGEINEEEYKKRLLVLNNGSKNNSKNSNSDQEESQENIDSDRKIEKVGMILESEKTVTKNEKIKQGKDSESYSNKSKIFGYSLLKILFTIFKLLLGSVVGYISTLFFVVIILFPIGIIFGALVLLNILEPKHFFLFLFIGTILIFLLFFITILRVKIKTLYSRKYETVIEEEELFFKEESENLNNLEFRREMIKISRWRHDKNQYIMLLIIERAHSKLTDSELLRKYVFFRFAFGLAFALIIGGPISLLFFLISFAHHIFNPSASIQFIILIRINFAGYPFNIPFIFLLGFMGLLFGVHLLYSENDERPDNSGYYSLILNFAFILIFFREFWNQRKNGSK
jgi:hypothetical protein